MSQKLLIVESPTKAKTISRFLGKQFAVESSFGHVRDLPKSKMGIDIAKNFEPNYVIPTRAKKRVGELKKLAKKADEIYFATDEDREGESIAWHLAMILGVDPTKSKRIVFHEITKEAILKSVEEPRHINLHLVDAQQARRILDRLVGYELSPFLWKKIRRGLSAGRVQSTALRLIVEREREIKNFKPQEYWTIEGDFMSAQEKTPFTALLSKKDGKKVEKLDIKNETEAAQILKDLSGATYHIIDIEQKGLQKTPPAPFTTSTLQQEANKKLGFSTKQTMTLAQQLYEGVNLDSGHIGLITYMRTDAVNLADKFLHEAQEFIIKNFGNGYALAEPRRYKGKQKLAQEAHEAIRPTDASRTPESIAAYLEPGQLKLYTLIWKRAVATQMAPAKIQSTGIDIATQTEKYTFRATGSVIEFDGYLKLYSEAIKEKMLPKISKGEKVTAQKIRKEQHFTEPPARFSEAALVKILEEHGIGRPSTYAPTISTIIDRGYVEKEEKKFKPTEIGVLVSDLLVEHFPKIVDYEFTAHMEDDLDEIASGQKQWQPIISAFYKPFKENLLVKEKEIGNNIADQATDKKCPTCGKPMIIKFGRFGKFLACTGFPECKTTEAINEKGEVEAPEKVDEKCEKCGSPMVVKFGRFGKFLSCSRYPECKGVKRIEKSTGITCPSCKKGEIVERHGKFGKPFYGCNAYPDCKFVVWSKPTGETCPTCGSLLIYGKKETIVCSKKDCEYKKENTETNTPQNE